MSNPTVTCVECGRTRDAMLHMRAEHPPTAARKWLKKTCSSGGSKPCKFSYRAGGLETFKVDEIPRGDS